MTQTSHHFPCRTRLDSRPLSCLLERRPHWLSHSDLRKETSQDHQGRNKAADSRNKSRFPAPGLSSQERPWTSSPPPRTGPWSRSPRACGPTTKKPRAPRHPQEPQKEQAQPSQYIGTPPENGEQEGRLPLRFAAPRDPQLVADWVSFNVIDTQWQGWARGWAALKRYTEREGHARLPMGHKEGA